MTSSRYRAVPIGAALIVAALLVVLRCAAPAWGQTALPCARFTQDAPAAPAPREASAAVRRFELINRQVKSLPYRILFLGDSITERFDPTVWRRDMMPRGVLNAGVSGDRTEHLLWRLEHGNLTGPAPEAAVLLIGTNDLTNGGHGRSAAVAAEGIRADLLYLRQHLPAARILLLGLWPRGAAPTDRLRRATVAVNRLIRTCGDNRTIVYADIGAVLLDPEGRLTRAVSPDLLHFSRLGYERLAPLLDALIDSRLAGR